MRLMVEAPGSQWDVCRLLGDALGLPSSLIRASLHPTRLATHGAERQPTQARLGGVHDSPASVSFALPSPEPSAGDVGSCADAEPRRCSRQLWQRHVSPQETLSARRALPRATHLQPCVESVRTPVCVCEMASAASLAAIELASSPITQVTQAPAYQEPDDVGEPDDDSPKAPPESFLRRLCSCLCGGPDDGTQRPLRPTPPRTIYVPPAPHTGNPFIPALQERDLGKKARHCMLPRPVPGGGLPRCSASSLPAAPHEAWLSPASRAASPDSRSCCAPRAQTLVLDLDETLVHSSFRPVPNPDYVIPVEIDGKVCPRAPGCTRMPARPPGACCAARRKATGLLVRGAHSRPSATPATPSPRCCVRSRSLMSTC
jgi:hypothetical protein